MKINLNLASRSYVNRRALYAFYVAMLGALSLLLAFNLFQFYRLQEHGRRTAAHLAEVEEKLGAGQKSREEEISATNLEKQRQEVDFANQILARDSFRWTDLLDRLEGVAVEGIAIRSLQPDYKEKSLKLTGQARGVKELRDFLDRLIASPDFSEVYLLSHSAVKVKAAGGERPAVDFSIDVEGVFR